MKSWFAETSVAEKQAVDVEGKLPAFIVCSGQDHLIEIAALTVIDRLIVAIHRAGAGPITIVTEDGPIASRHLRRTLALGIPVRFCQGAFERGEPGLVAEGNILVHADDARRCLASGSRLLSSDGAVLRLGFSGHPAKDLEAALAGAPEIQASRPAYRVVKRSAKTAETALWTSLASSSDGVVDRVFNRPVSRFLSKALAHTPASPNAISITSILIGVLAAFFFARGSPTAMLAGAILFQLSAIVDCVDGDIARILFKESPLGKWIDLAGDQVVHLAVFAGIALGVSRAGESPYALGLGLSAMAGTALSFAVVLRGMRGSFQKDGALQKLVDAATNRDFSVIILALAFARQLEWFLWMAAIGSHLFWITALALQWRARAAPR